MRETDKDKRGEPGDQKEYRGSHVGRDQSSNASVSQDSEASMSEEPPPTDDKAPKPPKGHTGPLPYGGRQEWQAGNHGSATQGHKEEHKP